jgi:hypothetical protein
LWGEQGRELDLQYWSSQACFPGEQQLGFLVLFALQKKKSQRKISSS